MQNKRKIAVIFLFVVISTFLTGCRTGKISEDMISYGYNKRIECIELVNKRDGEISVDYEVILLGKDNVILYKETFRDEIIKEHKVNLEDVKPDYISYEQVESMDLKILNVYSYSTFLLVLLIIVCLIAFAVILIVFFAWIGLI